MRRGNLHCIRLHANDRLAPPPAIAPCDETFLTLAVYRADDVNQGSYVDYIEQLRFDQRQRGGNALELCHMSRLKTNSVNGNYITRKVKEEIDNCNGVLHSIVSHDNNNADVKRRLHDNCFSTTKEKCSRRY